MRKYRNELKFYINKKDAEILKKHLALLMDVDKNSKNSDNTYLIRSLYFDDADSTAYYEKLDGIEFRKKYRIRIYNFDDSFIRLECKHKHDNKTSKDQILIDKDICSKIIEGRINEIDVSGDNLLTRFVLDNNVRPLKPSIIVDYKRLAYTYPVSDVRVTFDSEIKSGLYNYNLFDEDATTYSVIEEDGLILEVKFNEFLPESIAIILTTIPSIRQAFSKFAMCRSIK
ncbi:MAG: polyphosphate polymerase domain-containing protein [Firmicutes bacterium]|nr:polyphosphate polymerase domain-containing protein [Bacillota bacterium]